MMRIRHIVPAIAALVCACSIASLAGPALVPEAIRILPSLTTLDTYGQYTAGAYPAEYAALRRAYVPALSQGIPRDVLAYNTWMRDGHAVEAPVKVIRWSGGTVVWAHLCMPHDC